jgi:hypothetical protein
MMSIRSNNGPELRLVPRSVSALSFSQIGRLSFREIPGVIFNVPVAGFLLITHMFFPEQVVAGVTIIRNRHVEGTLWVFAIVHRHLNVDRTEVRVGDSGRGIEPGFLHMLAMILLRPAPPHSGHVGGGVGGYLPAMRAPIDQLADPACDPFKEGIKTHFCHIAFSLS